MKQFGKILRFELSGYLKNKLFIGLTVFLVVLIAVVMFIPNIAALFGPDDEPAPSENRPVMVICAEDGATAQAAAQVFAASFANYTVTAETGAADAVKDRILSGEVECAFELHGKTAYTYYVNNLSMYDNNTGIADEVLQTVYRTDAMVRGGLTPEQANEILTAQVSGDVVSLGKDQMQNFFYTYFMILALYMVILLYGQMVATNVAAEKSSRAMEVLITSAKPTSMMFGKVLASCIAGFIQLAAVFGSALLWYRVNRAAWGGNSLIESVFNIPGYLFVWLLVFFVLGFLIYAFLYGAIGSTASKLEDINTSVMPITFLFIIAFIVVVFSITSGNVDEPLIKVCSFIPFTSPMAMFTRICMSTVPWYEIAISVALLVATTVGVGVISAKIYRVGVLLYGTPPKLGAILKAVWKA